MSKAPKVQQTQQAQQHKGRAHEAQQKEQAAQEAQHITDTAQETQEERAERVKQERAAEDAAAEHMEALRGAFISPTGEEFILVDDNREYTTDELEALFSSEDAFQIAADTVRASLENIREQVRDFMKSDDMEKITEVFPDARQWALDNYGEYSMYVMIALLSVFSYVDVLPDYLKENGLEASLDAFTSQNMGTPERPVSALDLFLKYQQERDSAAAERKAPPVPLEVIGHRPKYFDNPRDRVSDKIFNAPEVNPDETLELAINTNPKDKKNNPYFSYSIDFSTVESEIPFVAKLTAFDRRVCIAYGALMEAGNDIFSYDQIFRAMGYDRNPRQSEKDAIDASLTKMSARARIDNKAEVSAGYHYDRFKYDGPFLAFERLTGVRINGKETDTAIHAFRYPFVLRIAAQRNELQKIPIAVLQSDLNRSDLVINLEDYIMGRISDIKRGYIKTNKILYSTMYDRLQVGDRKARKRIREYTERYLEHCKKVKWIKGYTIEKEGVTIEV